MSRNKKRNWTLYFNDMIDCCYKIQTYTEGFDIDSFENTGLNFDATIRNFQILGEAASNIPDEIVNLLPEVDWENIIAMRHKIVHGYFGIRIEILWDAVQTKIPDLEQKLEKFRTAHPDLFK